MNISFASDYERILSKRLRLCSVIRGEVSWLVTRSLDVTCSLAFADSTDELCVLVVTIKEKAFSFPGVIAPNVSRNREAVRSASS